MISPGTEATGWSFPSTEHSISRASTARSSKTLRSNASAAATACSSVRPNGASTHWPAADAAASAGRRLVDAILETPWRSDRLGQHVRNLFECLGAPDEGATLSLQCGERPDSPMR